jgi:hypothetical protein
MLRVRENGLHAIGQLCRDMRSDRPGVLGRAGFQDNADGMDHVFDNALIVKEVAAQKQHAILGVTGRGVLLNNGHAGFREHPLKTLARG